MILITYVNHPNLEAELEENREVCKTTSPGPENKNYSTSYFVVYTY